MQTRDLAPGVHAVRIDDDLVFLDVTADRYLCWPQAGGLELDPTGRRLLGDAPVDLDALAAAGLVCTRPQAPLFHSASTAPPTLDLRYEGTAHPDVATWRTFLAAGRDAAVTYRRAQFIDLLRYGAKRADGASPDAPPSEDFRRTVGSFHRWACWTPAPAKCLIRSFVLLRALRRRGHDARWVFAVRTWPFGAHCWLQAGPFVLDDAVERLTAYRPILVI